MSSLIKSKKLHSCLFTEEYLVLPSPIFFGSHGIDRKDDQTPEEIAQSIIANAKEEAYSLIASAQAQSDEIRTAAYAEGNQAALLELQEQKIAAEQRFAEIEADMMQQIEQFWVDIQPQVAKLSVEIAGKVIGQEIDENKETVINTVNTALRQLRDRQELKIRVSPNEYKLVRESKDAITSASDGIKTLEIIDDRRVGDGGCIIETTNGDLDARIETQLAEVERALMEDMRDAA